MELEKWSRCDLERYGKKGFKVYPCEDEEEALCVKSFLKENGRCVRAGYYKTDLGKDKYFVLTKERLR